MLRTIILTLLASPLLAGPIPQNFTFAAVGSFTPGPVVTYTENVRPVAGSPYAWVTESSSPCNLEIGCDMGDFTLTFPKISLPANFDIVSASIMWDFGAGQPYTGNLYNPPISVTPIDPGQPYTSGGGGSLYELFTPTCTCYAFGLGIPGYSAIPTEDFTSEVTSALAGNGDLAPITGSWYLKFGFQTEQSAYAGINAVTVFQDIFELSSLSPTATIVITAVDPPPSAQVPEPATWLLILAGLAVLISVKLVNRTRERAGEERRMTP